jgi:glycosyltransferase involved in cell wall biosynthesis
MPGPLSVVMPAYNEEASIAEAVREVVRVVLDVVPGSRLIVVDDGSRDRTGAILDALSELDPRICVIHQANGGHGSALMTGLERSAAEWVLLVDSDQQIPVGHFSAFWERRHEVDGVLGSRVVRKDGPSRRFVTFGLRQLLRFGLGAPVVDANVPFKLIRRTVWDEVLATIPDDCLIPSVFIAVWLHRCGRAHVVLPVSHRGRAAGRTSLIRLELVRFCWRAFLQAAAYRRTLSTRGRLQDPR